MWLGEFDWNGNGTEAGWWRFEMKMFGWVFGNSNSCGMDMNWNTHNYTGHR